MPSFFHFLILGIVQGVCEFLPISSTGHLVLYRHIFGVRVETPILGDVLLHLGTVLSIIVFLQPKKIIDDLTSNYRGLIISFIFTIPTALIFERVAEIANDNIYLLSFLFVFGGSILLGSKVKKNLIQNNFIRYAFIGVLQGIAALPGVSRSGSTISGALIMGFSPDYAFRFSFLLSIPTILSAAFYEILKHYHNLYFGWGMLFGMFLSFIFGVISLYILKKVVISLKLHLFGFYMFAVGFITFLYFILR